jgi:hypothetical protein
MPQTYEPIASATGTGSSIVITFDNIPGTYTDLVLVVESPLSQFTGTIWVQFNNDTGTNYSATAIDYNISGRNTNQTFAGISAANAQNNGWISTTHIMNYSNTTTNKTLLNFAGFGGPTENGGPIIRVSLWRSTAAITKVVVSTNQTAANFTTNATYKLFGIKAA